MTTVKYIKFPRQCQWVTKAEIRRGITVIMSICILLYCKAIIFY